MQEASSEDRRSATSSPSRLESLRNQLHLAIATAQARIDVELEQIRRGAATGGSTEMEAFLRRPSTPSSPAEAGSVRLSQLPTLAVRFMRTISPEPLPETWSAPAAVLARRLQHLLLLSIGIVGSCVIFDLIESFRAGDVWHRSGDLKCDVQLRPWLGTHALALAIVPCMTCYCAYVALVALMGWAIVGLVFVQEHARSSKECDPIFIRMAWELIGADLALVTFAFMSCCVAACAFVTAIRAVELSTAWDPESCLDIAFRGDFLEEEAQEDKESGEDRKTCAICWAGLSEPIVRNAGDEEIGSPLEGAVAQIKACGHRFHLQCVLPWLHAKRTCPICRARADRPPRQQSEDARQSPVDGRAGAERPLLAADGHGAPEMETVDV